MYAAWSDRDENDLLGYVAIGTSHGYGGPLTLAVATSNPHGEIVGLALVAGFALDHRLNPALFRKIVLVLLLVVGVQLIL